MKNINQKIPNDPTTPTAFEMLREGGTMAKINIAVLAQLALVYALFSLALALTTNSIISPIMEQAFSEGSQTNPEGFFDIVWHYKWTLLFVKIPSLFLFMALMTPYIRLVAKSPCPAFVGGFLPLITTALRQSFHLILAIAIVVMLFFGIQSLMSFFAPLLGGALLGVIAYIILIWLLFFGYSMGTLTIIDEALGHKKSVFDAISIMRGRSGNLVFFTFLILLSLALVGFLALSLTSAVLPNGALNSIIVDIVTFSMGAIYIGGFRLYSGPVFSRTLP